VDVILHQVGRMEHMIDEQGADEGSNSVLSWVGLLIRGIFLAVVLLGLWKCYENAIRRALMSTDRLDHAMLCHAITMLWECNMKGADVCRLFWPCYAMPCYENAVRMQYEGCWCLQMFLTMLCYAMLSECCESAICRTLMSADCLDHSVVTQLYNLYTTNTTHLSSLVPIVVNSVDICYI
jgi:hypothetical protein